MLFAHGPLSVLVNEYIQKKQLRKIDLSHIPTIIVIAFTSGILPDFDFFILAAQSKPAYLHHNLITHTPIFWLAAAFLLRQSLFIARRFLKKNEKQVITTEFINSIVIAFLVGTMSHLLMDLPFGFIMLFYPLSHYAFSIFGSIFRLNPTINYLTQPMVAVELYFVALFVYKMLERYFVINKAVLRIGLIASSVLASALFIFSGYMYFNTYNPTVYKDEYNRPIFDMDKDLQIDFLDADMDNNGRDNVQDVDRKKIAEVAKKIGNSNKLVSINSDKVRERYGVLTPFTLISTTYYESRKTLEPVIRQYFTSKNEKYNYSLNSYYKLLQERNSLVGFNAPITDDLHGHTLFILNNDLKVINAGIIINNSELLIISPFDKRLENHKISEITDLYEAKTFKYLVER